MIEGLEIKDAMNRLAGSPHTAALVAMSDPQGTPTLGRTDPPENGHHPATSLEAARQNFE
ncbi:MAG: hypothetical protein L0L18_12315 [Acidipropionibacterium jensenii]|nr:hypothetical protein [Acidipropionibacterium jensenii]